MDRTAIQTKTFTRWVNTHLADKDLHIDDLSKDFENGVLLIELLQIISGKKIKKWKKKPKMMAQKLENLNKALMFIKKEGIVIVNIGANDINSGNTKIILGLIWTLILRYQINKGEFEYDGRRGSMGMEGKPKKKSTKKKKDGAKKELLKWVNEQLKPYGESVKNFKNDWKDPMKICCLTDSLQPGLVDVEKVKGDSKADDTVRTADIQDAMTKAETHYDIPQVLDAGDMACLPDELSVMTYVSYFREAQKVIAKKAQAAEKSFAEGPGLEDGPVGEKREFFVHTITNDDKPMTPDGDEALVEVTISDSDGNDVKVEVCDPDRPGVYPIVYEVNNPGSYMINCKVKGAHLKGFPKTVVMAANGNASDVKTCDFSFTVQAANPSGQEETEGGDTFEVEVKNCSSRQNFNVSDAKDNGDGSYTAAYTLTLGHLYRVYAKLNGAPIANTPFIHDLRTDVDKANYVY